VKPYVPAGWVAPDSETAVDVQEGTSAAVDAMVVTEGDVATAHPRQFDADEEDATLFDEPNAADGTAVGNPVNPVNPVHPVEGTLQGNPVNPVEGTPSRNPVDERRGEDPEADDQLAMFGVVRPDDPEPVKAKRSRSRKTTPASGAKAKRARKTTTARTPSRRTRS
jgi:hypothetical protein